MSVRSEKILFSACFSAKSAKYAIYINHRPTSSYRSSLSGQSDPGVAFLKVSLAGFESFEGGPVAPLLRHVVDLDLWLTQTGTFVFQAVLATTWHRFSYLLA